MPNTAVPQLTPEDITTILPNDKEGSLEDQLFNAEVTTQESADVYADLRQRAIDASHAIYEGDITGANINIVLEAWKYSYDKKEGIVPIDDDAYYERERWIRDASDFTRVIDRIIMKEGSDVSEFSREKLHLLTDHVISGEMASPGLVAEFIAQRIWRTYDIYANTKPRWEGMPPHQLHLDAEKALHSNAQIAADELTRILPLLSENVEGRHYVRSTFEYLQASQQQDLANRLLLAENLTDDQRLHTAVQYINVYGFVPTADLLSHEAKRRPDIKVLYEKLQGNKVREVMKDLWEMYKLYEQSADFAHYYDDEVTKRDLSIIEKWAVVAEKRFGKEKSELYAMSLAAGKGRMAFALADAGYSVTAVEPMEQYADSILAQKGDRAVSVLKRSWNNLSIEDLPQVPTKKDFEHELATQDYLNNIGGEEMALKLIGKRKVIGIEIGECTGRSLPHGNTPQRLLEAFDTIRSVSKNGAIWVVDFMDPQSGKFQRNIESLRNNLIGLGVDPYTANITFEGPNQELNLNRMTISQEQMGAYAELLGFKILEVIPVDVESAQGPFVNTYYVLEVDEEYYPEELGRKRFAELLDITGLTQPGVDLNEPVKTWKNMSIGQAIVFELDLTTDEINKISGVRFIRKGKGGLELEGSYRGRRD